MNDEQAADELSDAVLVFRARRRLDAAIADLASRPLDEATAERMRHILASDELAAARQSLASLAVETAPPVLYAVPDGGGL